MMSRAIGAQLTDAWGHQVVVDNRPGANGLLACEIVAKAAPDGYTLLMANIGSHGINPGLYKKLPYDAVNDFTPVTRLGWTANVLVVPPSSPAGSLKEFVALAKSKPGQLTYGSNGSGSSQHLAGVMFSTAFGIDLIHVPYKGTNPVIIDLIAGNLSLSFSNMLPVLPQIKGGRLKPLAVTSLKRSQALPEIPAIAETLPGFEAISWWGIVAPAKTPGPIVNKLNQEIARRLELPEVKERFDRQGVVPQSSTPEEFSAYIKAEIAKWAKVVKDSGARAD
jgi:tripartite-type tricarboxylate transporter receptor subunit TctC